MTQYFDTTPESSLVSPVARRFVDALREIEEHGEVEDMAGLGTEHTRWWSTGVDRDNHGPDGARRFWEAYRRSFGEITSEFTTVTEGSDRVVLEWTGHGRHHNGRPVRYAGATVLELSGSTEDRQLDGVRLYFDTAAALSPATEKGAERPETEGAASVDDATRAAGRSSGLAPEDADEAKVIDE